MLVPDVEGFSVYVQSIWVAVYRISTHPNDTSGYLLASQHLNLEDHAISDVHLLGLFLYGGLSPFKY